MPFKKKTLFWSIALLALGVTTWLTPLYKHRVHSTKNRQDQPYDTIIIPFEAIKHHYPEGRKQSIQGIVLHCPTIPCIFKTISVLENRSVGCHYIIPEKTLGALKKDAQHLLSIQNTVQEEERLSPVALNACRVIIQFKGALNEVPILQLAQDETCVAQAGIGNWKDWPTGPEDLRINRPTIGIEFGNSARYDSNQDDLYRNSDQQTRVLIWLLKHLVAKHHLSGRDIVTHSDIAWNRAEDLYKPDPGPYFPYETLARHQLGFAPLAKDFPPLPKDYATNPAKIIAWVQTCFRIMGYAPCPSTGVMDLNTLKILRAYALHFFPACAKYTPDYDWNPLIQSLLNHPLAPYFLTDSDSFKQEEGARSFQESDFTGKKDAQK